MIRVLALIPVLGRPERAKPLVESFWKSVTGPHVRADLTFLCSPGDDDQRNACKAVSRAGVAAETMLWPQGPGDYARKINYGWEIAVADGYDFVLLGADDLVFHPGWVEAAMITYFRTGACVIGTNDLGNPKVISGEYATHPIVSTAYRCGIVDNPDPTLLLNPAYTHNFVDTEFIDTAKQRGVYAPCPEAWIEHLHPFWGKGVKDDTYRQGQVGFTQDSKLYRERRKLWAE